MDETVQLEIPEPHRHLSELIHAIPEGFATGEERLKTAALAATKATFDAALSQEERSFIHIREFLGSLVNAIDNERRETRAQKNNRMQQTEDNSELSQAANNMRGATSALDNTPLDSLLVEDMGVDQIWSQPELRTQKLCNVLEHVLDGEFQDPAAIDGRTPLYEEEDEEDDSMDEEMDEEFSNEDVEEDEESESSEDEDLGEHFVPLVNAESLNAAERKATLLDRLKLQQFGPKPKRANKSRHPTLDDDFFSIADFNREISTAEAKSSSKGGLGDDSDDSEKEGSLDLFAEIDEDEQDEEPTGETTLMYQDFFAEPSTGITSQKTEAETNGEEPERDTKVRFHEEVRVKLIKSRRNKLSLLREMGEIDGLDDSDEDEDEDGDELDEDEDELDGADEDMPDGDMDMDASDDDDIENQMDEDESGSEDQSSVGEEGFDAIERIKDDLFAEEELNESDLSTFAQRQLALKKQIEELEQENISKKDWTLQGEATLRARPLNSLLEEDLDFEHVQRVVPVITEEKVKSLEDMIKARILENRFDDVVRRRPMDDKPFLPSSMFELQDSKSAQSLAQIYEDEYTAARSGGGSELDSKLQKEHDELDKIWETISGKLDALCNAHFTPKAPKGIITAISNVASTSLESALPTIKSSATLLAPEEIYSSAASKNTSGGAPASRSELTPEEKKSLRTKSRKQKMKMRARLDTSVDKYAKMNNPRKAGSNSDSGPGKGIKGKEKKEKEQALKQMVKTGRGVTVVGKKTKK